MREMRVGWLIKKERGGYRQCGSTRGGLVGSEIALLTGTPVQWRVISGRELALAKTKNCLQFGAEKKKRHGLRPNTEQMATTDKDTKLRPVRLGLLAPSAKRSHANKPTP